MSHFIEDVGNIFTAPVREIAGIFSGSDKYNSIGDIYNHTIGPDNPIADTFQNEGLNKASYLFSEPSWNDLGKPGQAFASQVDKGALLLPPDWRPYAEPVEATALSLFNPFAGAAFQTAYEGGKEQQQNKGFDWGDLGKNAAINFGSAGIAQGAKSLLTADNVANAAKASASSFANSPNGLVGAFNAGNTVNSLTSVGSNFAPAAQAGNLAANSATALNGIGAIPAIQSAVDGFNPNLIGSSASITPNAQNLQTSGLGDKIYQGAINTGKTLGTQALASTLAPQGTQPIAGSFDGFSPTDSTGSGGYQYGDLLNAFGGSEINTANPNGPRIDANAFNGDVNRLAANSYLQQQGARDTAIPAGQYTPEQNTPYANRLNEINKGTTQSYADLLDEVNNANSYYSVIDANPGLTTDQLDTYLNDPSTGVLGQFTIPADQAQLFQGIRPLNPNTNSLLH